MTILIITARVFVAVLLNGLVLGTAVAVQRRYFSASSYPRHQRWLIVALLAWSFVTLITLGLGLAGGLRLRYALMFVSALFATTIWMMTRSTEAPRGWSVLRLDLRIPGAGRIEYGMALLAGALLVVLAGVNLVSPPANWDSLTYHLAFPTEWYQTGRLTIPTMGFGDLAPSYYPVNSSLLYLWLLLPFGSLAVADVGQASFVGLLALAVYALGRALNQSSWAALWGGLLTSLTPMALLNGALWSYNDISFAALWLLTLVFGLIFARDPGPRNAVLCGITLGLFVGTKGFALLFTLVAAPLVLLGLYRAVVRGGLRPALLLLLAGGLPILLLGSFSYLRNLVLASNPLFPYITTVPGFGDLPGLLYSSWFKLHPFHQFNLRQLPIQPGYAPVWALSALAMPLALREIIANRTGLRVPLLAILGLAALYLALFITTLPIRDVRFLVAPHALLALACSICLAPSSRSPGWYQAVLPVAAGLAIAVSLLSALFLMDLPFNPQPISSTFTLEVWGEIAAIITNPARLVPGLLQYTLLVVVAGLCLWGLQWLLQRGMGMFEGGVLIFVVCLVIALGVRTYDVREYSAYTRAAYMGLGVGWRWVDQNVSGATIIPVGTTAPLPLHGHQLKNTVRYISATPYDTLHAFTRNGGVCSGFACDREQLHEESWRQRVEAFAADYVFVVEQPGRVWEEEEWMRAAPDAFAVVYEDPNLRIWRVLGDERVGGASE